MLLESSQSHEPNGILFVLGTLSRSIVFHGFLLEMLLQHLEESAVGLSAFLPAKKDLAVFA